MRRLAFALFAICSWSTEVFAADRAACPEPLSRASVAPCALERSSLVMSAQDRTRALQGVRTAALPLFPMNPTLSGSFARRSVPNAPSVWNWSVGLSQEIEIAGQRGHRIDAADADVAAAEQRTVLTKRYVVADALLAYFAVLGARAGLAMTKQLDAIARSLATAATAAATAGIISGIDGDLAEIASFRAVQARIGAEGALATAQIELTTRLGHDPTLGRSDAIGDLTPLAGVEADARTALGLPHPEVVALKDEGRAWAARAALFRAAVVPNVTLSAFVQNDGFDERVLGLGIAFPIPFPQPIGRTFVGEAREADALADRGSSEATRIDRERRGRILTALSDYDTQARAVDAVPADRIERAKISLGAIAQEVSGGRLAVRDAILAQQSLTALLLEQGSAKLRLCIASVELARAASLPLEGGMR
ncbi:hypothetical protein BH09MYX1_BH09MYX1_26590 [soil metagenome]